jgi:hypothetical protein
MNTVVSALVLVIILCFIIPTRATLVSQGVRQGFPIAIAQSLVVGFIAAVASAWFIQLGQGRSTGCGLPPQPHISDAATYHERLFFYERCEVILGDEMAWYATRLTWIPGIIVMAISLFWLTYPWISERFEKAPAVSDQENADQHANSMASRTTKGGPEAKSTGPRIARDGGTAARDTPASFESPAPPQSPEEGNQELTDRPNTAN